MREPPSTESRPDKELFFEALEVLDPGERTAFLDRVCSKDPEKRRRLEELLEHHFRRDAFMDEPVVENARGHSPVDVLSEAPGSILGRYKLLEKIGEGGFGVVYVAEQKEPIRRHVALKVIKLGMDTRQVVARFEAERQALAMMDHPNIAKVLDAGAAESGRPYFVMELVRGTRITQYCQENELSMTDRLKLFIQVCQAIQHAHQKGIIHRDIKPSNIIVTQRDGVPVPKVIDFGIAKAIEGDLTEKTIYTQYHHFLGTPAYMSPEQAEMSGLDIDTRTDIYSLGVLLYELLTGTTPFDAHELMSQGIDAIRKTIREKEPPRPSTRLAQKLRTAASQFTSKSAIANPKSQIHSDLDWIVMKCLEKDRARRYETANGITADIQRYLVDDPVMARPPTAAYRFQKAWQRHKLAFTAGTIVAAALIAATGISIWQAVLATRARRAALQSQDFERRERWRADAEKLTALRDVYALNMRLLQQAAEQNDLLRVRQLLEKTRAYAERGFEWYYWQRQSRLASKLLEGHSAAVTSVGFAPGGHRLLTASNDRTAKVWDVTTGRQLLSVADSTRTISSAAWFPNGQKFVTGGVDGVIRIWDGASGNELFSLTMSNSPITSVAIAQEGQFLGAGQSDGTVRIWKMPAAHEVLTMHAHPGEIRAIAFSPDGQRLATAGPSMNVKTGLLAPGGVKIWETATGSEQLALDDCRDKVNSLAFSPNARQLLAASDDATARLWDVISGKEILKMSDHSWLVKAVAFAADGQQFATASKDWTVRIRQAADGKTLFTRNARQAIRSVAFSGDRQRIAAGCGDGKVFIWELQNPWSPPERLPQVNGAACVAFSPDNQWIVAGSPDQTAAVWNAATHHEAFRLRGHAGPVVAVAFSKNGRRILTGSDDGTARVWDAADGRELLRLTGHTGSVRSVVFSPLADRILTGSDDGTVRLWEAATGHELHQIRGFAWGVRSVAFSPDGKRFVAVSGDYAARMWDAASGSELPPLKGHTAGLFSVAFSPDGQRIVTGGSDEIARVWDAATARELFKLEGHDGAVWSVAFSSDNRRIITGAADKTVRLWDAATGLEVLALHGQSDIRAAISANSRLIAATDHLGVQIWEIASSDEEKSWGQTKKELDAEPR